MKTLAADLHLHSVLSPCGDLAMSPRAIVERAASAGLDLVAISDHNHGGNAPALREAAAAGGVAALYGVEIRSEEEVDTLVLFDTPEAAVAYGEWAYEALPDVPCDERRYGDQVVVDADETVLEFVPRLLVNATHHSLDAVVAEGLARGALVVAAHVDRAVDSVISQLGWLPDDLPVDAIEITRFHDEAEVLAEHPSLAGRPVVRFSDAHLPDDIGVQRTLFHVADATVRELRAALEGRDGRWCRPLQPERSVDVWNPGGQL